MRWMAAITFAAVLGGTAATAPVVTATAQSASERQSITSPKLLYSSAKLRPQLRISASRKVYPYRSTAKLRAHLGDTASNRTLTIRADPARGKTKVIRRGRVDSSGNLRARYPMKYTTTFTVTFTGDDLYERRTASTVVNVHCHIDTSMKGAFGLEGSTYLFRRGDVPQAHIEVSPNVAGALVMIQVEERRHGTWANVSSGAFNYMPKSSTYTSIVPGAAASANTRFRWRANIGGTTIRSTNSKWVSYVMG